VAGPEDWCAATRWGVVADGPRGPVWGGFGAAGLEGGCVATRCGVAAGGTRGPVGSGFGVAGLDEGGAATTCMSCAGGPDAGAAPFGRWASVAEAAPAGAMCPSRLSLTRPDRLERPGDFGVAGPEDGCAATRCGVVAGGTRGPVGGGFGVAGPEDGCAATRCGVVAGGTRGPVGVALGWPTPRMGALLPGAV